MTEELKKAKEMVCLWEEQILINECSDNLYFSSGRWAKDKKELEFWKNKIKKLEEIKND